MEGVQKILNDVTTGDFDVVMDTGPGYSTKRQESVDAMLQLFAAEPSLVQVAGDLLVRNMDFPGADVIADRLSINNPLAQIDDMSELPASVQMKLKQGEAQVQQLQQQVEQLTMMIKQRQDIEQVKQDSATKRELMKQTQQADSVEKTNESRIQQTALETQTRLEIEAIKSQLALVLAKMTPASEKSAEAEAIERAI
jgi:hypothetical protein